MEVFCPRCDTSIPDITSELIDSGICPKCSGQVYLGRGDESPEIEDFLALLFEPGCNVAVPLDASTQWGSLATDEPLFEEASALASELDEVDIGVLEVDATTESGTGGDVLEQSDALDLNQGDESTSSQESDLPELPELDLDSGGATDETKMDLLESQSIGSVGQAELRPSKRGLIVGIVVALIFGGVALVVDYQSPTWVAMIVDLDTTDEAKAILNGDYSGSQRAWFSYQAGHAAFLKGDFPQALSYFEKALELKPTLAVAYRGKGSALVKMEKYDLGRKAYRNYLERETNSNLWGEVKELLERSEN